MFHETYHERVAPSVAFEVVECGLLDVAHISKAQVRLLDGDVEREELANGWLVVESGEIDVVLPVSCF